MRVLIALLLATICSTPQAQDALSELDENNRTTLSAVAIRRALTSGGHVGAGAGLSVAYNATSWGGISATVLGFRSKDVDPISLLVVDSRWHDRTQLSLDFDIVLYPVRTRALGVRHRFGLATGPSLRWRDERHLVAGSRRS